MGPQDGLDGALRALAKLHSERDDWHAVFMGGGEVLGEMRRLARTLGLEAIVEFTGPVDDDVIVPMLSTADVCLAPEPWSPFNDRSTMMKVVEYMAMARPVVAFELKETRASAADAAVYAPPGDEDAFARNVSALLDDPARREALGRVGRERVEHQLGWDRSRTELLRAYERALSGSRR
jgi:glycosyltransferase involved in cell wall biosynthesis